MGPYQRIKALIEISESTKTNYPMETFKKDIFEAYGVSGEKAESLWEFASENKKRMLTILNSWNNGIRLMT